MSESKISFGKAVTALKRQRRERGEARPEGAVAVEVKDVDLASLRTVDAVFQPRALEAGKTHEDHAIALKAALKQVTSLEPLTVLPVGAGFVVVDGHHRLAAYRGSGRTAPIPVREFVGNVEGAIIHSRQANSRAVVPLTAQERTEAAWKLVLLGTRFSKAEVRRATSVSDGTVGTMRKVAKTLGESAARLSWFQALAEWKGRSRVELDEDEEEAELDSKADILFERLRKAFGLALTKQVDLLGRGIRRNMPTTAALLAAELLRGSGGIEDDDEPSDEAGDAE